jgi:hypothetical protein
MRFFKGFVKLIQAEMMMVGILLGLSAVVATLDIIF